MNLLGKLGKALTPRKRLEAVVDGTINRVVKGYDSRLEVSGVKFEVIIQGGKIRIVQVGKIIVDPVVEPRGQVVEIPDE